MNGNAEPDSHRYPQGRVRLSSCSRFLSLRLVASGWRGGLLGLVKLPTHVLLGIGVKLALALGRAEVVRRAFIHGLGFDLARGQLHATHGIAIAGHNTPPSRDDVQSKARTV